MKKTLLTIYVLLIALIFISFNSVSETNEIIRRKIENRKIVTLMAEGDLIYCVSSLSKIYENRMFSLAWGNKNYIEQLIRSIESSEEEGLNSKDYHLDILSKLYSNYSNLIPEQKVHIDMLATDAFLLLTSDLLSGKVNPISIDSEWHVKRREGDPVLLFEEAIKNNNVLQIINDCLPRHKVYLGLKKALAKYKEIKDEGGWERITEGVTLEKGSVDDRVILVKKRLLITKDLSKVDLGDLRHYDDKLFDAVIIFQKRHNLEADGSIGKLTISAMNVSVDDRIDQIKVNMERWRWLPGKTSIQSIAYIRIAILDGTDVLDCEFSI